MTTRETYVPDSVLEFPPLDPAHSALVVIDMVNWQVPREAGGNSLSPAYLVDRLAEQVIPANVRLLAACRAAGFRVVFLRIGSGRDDYADVVPSLQALYRETGARDGTAACTVIDELSVEPGDLSLLKTGSGGYTTAALGQHLREWGVRDVVYSGVLTTACILLTVAAGFDLGYRGYVVTDATAAHSAELQDSTELLMGQFMAQLTTTDELLARLSEITATAP